MKTRSFIITLLLLLAVLPSKAVLKERNLAGTLAMLRIELTEYRQKLESETGARKEQSQQVMNQLLATMNKSQQNAIMLYSQKNGYVFDLSYACHEATEQYKTFKNTVGPFRSYVENANVETANFALLFEFDGDIKKIRHVLYKCAASRPSIESQTNEDEIEVQTETLSLKATPLANGFVKAKTGDDTTDAVYQDWYKAVYMTSTTTNTESGVES